MMNSTSVSVLDRLKLARPDASDWNRLQGIYLPLISRWLGHLPGLGDEAADLAQEVFIVVIRELPRFEMKLTVNAVLQAKSRILKRLREEAGELLA
jgi:RNA polymerase sigma-70 factor, ECF subfamily